MKDLVLQNCRLDGRYDVRDRLGRGSYAEIFSAVDTLASTQSPHSTVVIKALNVFLQNDLDHDLERTLVENFQNEAIALDRVRHPNILSRLGHGTAKDLQGTVFHYLVLEYLPGGDLSKFARDHKIEFHQALDFIEQVCAGLAHAHKHDIIHRDIKPQNLLLTSDHKIVKIADFGVARNAASDSPVTRVGTNVYAPPEHSPLLSGSTGGLNNAVTPAADIYSLAKTCYVLLTGESPRFSSNKPITALPHAMEMRSWAPKLVEILKKATANDRLERHQTVFDFWKDISVLREYSAGSDSDSISTRVAQRYATLPQAQIARGFNPLAPTKPKFDTDKRLKFTKAAPTRPLDKFQFDNLKEKPAVMAPVAASLPVAAPPMPIEPVPQPVDPPKKRRRLLKAALTFGILLVVFAGSLFATYNYLIGNPIFTGLTRPAVRTGVAKTDINLRPSPTTSNIPIGLVTKNSKIKILRTSNNWHEVVIIQHGRVRNTPRNAVRGWVYGTYIAEDR
jgi:serine/threonine protein kinase